MKRLPGTRVKIRVKNVSKSFIGEFGERIDALHNVTFDVYENEFFCILGPSGCGKTTLLRIIAGLERPDTGYVEVDGRRVSEPLRRVGYIPQDYSLFPWRTVLGNVEFGLEVLGVPERERRRIAQKYIDLVGLSGFERLFPKELSGGMKQKVAIARALAISPVMLLLDEPFADLDAQTRMYMQREILRIWNEEQITVLFVTHSVEEAVFLADRILLLTARPGRVKKIIKVGLERPRRRTSEEFVSLVSKILHLLEEELHEQLV
ncbi:MAG: ABC transporter ATP-binding protein [Candidatus Baldrarchaeia archaeon]